MRRVSEWFLYVVGGGAVRSRRFCRNEHLDSLTVYHVTERITRLIFHSHLINPTVVVNAGMWFVSRCLILISAMLPGWLWSASPYRRLLEVSAQQRLCSPVISCETVYSLEVMSNSLYLTSINAHEIQAGNVR